MSAFRTGHSADDAESIRTIHRALDLGIGFVPYSPLGHGFLTCQIRSTAGFAEDDWRRSNPRFMGENLQRDLRVADEVKAVADEVGATSAQVALA
ncbi:aldo/keto reductase [Streptomyces phaeochromogenes]|uniref:aldo/keto reductase n=1 Tax=Streptomyces phaeochromogenes TaxID=1923 RepID=UPI00368C8CAE